MKTVAVLLVIISVVTIAVAQSGIYTNIQLETYSAYYAVAPRVTLTTFDGNVEKRAIGPAGWMCTEMEPTDSDPAYQRIRSYQEGGNEEGRALAFPETYPIVEIYSSRESLLCIYLDDADQCYPPRPFSPDIFHINQHYIVEYYGRSFWGQASFERILYEQDKLYTALENLGVTDAVLEVLQLSYYPDHEREIRVDAEGTYGPPPPPPTPFPPSSNHTNSSLTITYVDGVMSIGELSGEFNASAVLSTNYTADGSRAGSFKTLASRMTKLF